MRPPGRFVNHSCSPNTHAKDFCDVANKDIAEGEEITADYRETSPGGLNEFKCNCGSKRCGKRIFFFEQVSAAGY
ncbi:TPA: SET domain-containing protein [Candidatus Micrarchaeota archaeon]|nr:MAG: hypothetical protein AUJ65_03065 [Candidatus Micrarchaeota archaeon CG1_02_51_15]HII39524.1 SET domain-containing protein [Candidatus Micrarchaeota archaeon]